MSKYAVTGSLHAAANALDRAAQSMCPAPESEDAKLRDRILRAVRAVERIEARAKKLIPGGFKHVPNTLDADKRTQREEHRA